MKYICPILLSILILFILTVWLIPSETEWHATQLRVCSEMEMEKQLYNHTNAKDIEERLRTILNGPCQEYFEGYILAMAEANPIHQKILHDPDSSDVVRKKFEAMSIIWLSTLYLNVPPQALTKKY